MGSPARFALSRHRVSQQGLVPSARGGLSALGLRTRGGSGATSGPELCPKDRGGGWEHGTLATPAETAWLG